MPADFSRFDAGVLAEAWRRARPFPHVILDDLLPAAELQALREAVARTPHFPNVLDFYEMMGSPDKLTDPVIDAFHETLAGPGLELAVAISGKQPEGVSLRSYVYLAGSYLLPHDDQGVGDLGRILAWTYYLLPRTSCTGGELELFECELEGSEIVKTRPAVRIDPVENRFVLFDVSPVSLHQVREVETGGRVSLSGWYVK